MLIFGEEGKLKGKKMLFSINVSFTFNDDTKLKVVLRRMCTNSGFNFPFGFLSFCVLWF